jgi:hypothetical protein
MNIFKSLLVVVVAIFFSISSAQAESLSTRDAAVDSILLSSPGILPATAGQSVGAGPVGTLPTLSAIADRTQQKTLPLGDQDHKARIYELKGNAKIKTRDAKGWQKLEKGRSVEKGAVLLTEKHSSLSITFDERYLNVVHIPENTRAEVRSIEPTDIYLEDGTLFNILDGLPKGSEWKIASSTAVAAVRGTHYVVHYSAANGDYLVATLNAPEDGQNSEINLVDLLQNGKTGESVDVPEGKQIYLKANESPDTSLLKDIDSIWAQQIREFMERLLILRNPKPEGFLPATSGEMLGDSGFQEPDQTANLDPQLDTGAALDEPLSVEESFDSSESPSEEDPKEPTEFPTGEQPCTGDCN